MNKNNLFIDGYVLPDTLPKDEFLLLLEKTQQGDRKAKDKLIVHNLRLITYEINLKFNNIKCDKEDLVTIGFFGLEKAIENYDLSKKVSFSRYAIKCIDNEIFNYLNEIKKHDNVCSLNQIICANKTGDTLLLEDIISDNYNFVEEYEQQEVYHAIREIIEKMSPMNREIIKLYFGFYDEKYSQRQIAEKFGVSKQLISVVVRGLLGKMKIILERQKFIESYNKNDSEKVKKISYFKL